LENVECDCGLNLHAEGDLGELGLQGADGVGGSLNIDKDGNTTGSLSFQDPAQPIVNYVYDPEGAPKPPVPSLAVGAGAFSGGGFNWCF
jgi:hypothetical protein